MTPQLYAFTTSLRRFFGRHHPVIFMSVIGILFAVAIFMLYQVFMLTTALPESSGSSIANFDQKTIEKIKQLHDRNNADTTISLPSPRPNPFVE